MVKGQWRRRVKRLVRGITHPEEELSRWQRRVALAWSAARFAGTRLRRHKAPQLAAALAYRTVFSLIPLLVLALVGLRTLYGEEGIRQVLDTTVEFLGFDELTTPGGSLEGLDDDDGVGAEGDEGASDGVDGEGGEGQPPRTFNAQDEIRVFVDRAVEQVRSINGRLIAVVGVAVLIYSAVSLLFQIEMAFNVVCGATRRRKWVHRFASYWTLITIGAIGLVVTIAIGESARDALDSLPGWLAWIGYIAQWLAGVGVTWLLLLFAYTQIPTTRIHLRPAAIGALVAALVWEVLKNSVTGLIGAAFAGQVAVYSSLAIIPVSLLWIYLTWLIVLYGLELTHLLQVTPAALRRTGLTGPVDSACVVMDTGAIAAVARAAVAAFERGDSISAETIAPRTGLDEDMLTSVLDRLVEEGVLSPLEGQDEEARRYALLRPGDQVMMGTMVRIARSLSCTPGGVAERRTALAVRDRMEEVLADVPLVAPDAPDGGGGVDPERGAEA